MWRAAWAAMILLIFPAAGYGQAASNDSGALRELLTEVRELRRDLHATAGAMERAQILIHRVDAQQQAVARAFQRVETARANLAQIQKRRASLETNLKRLNDARSDNEDANQKRANEETIEYLKGEIESEAGPEGDAQAKVNELEDQVRLEQAKLNDLEARLDTLDRELEAAGR